jgi:hypothetical protein
MKAIGWVVSPLLSALGVFKGPKMKAPGPNKIPTRDDARDQADRVTELARRRGGAADIVTGAYGAEAGAGGKTTLGS